mgnify:CR=1 FL=1
MQILINKILKWILMNCLGEKVKNVGEGGGGGGLGGEGGGRYVDLL